MAGAISHLLVADRAIRDLGGSNGHFCQLLGNHREFVLLGAVSPDLPYLEFPDVKQRVWADLMHNERSNGVPLHFVEQLTPGNFWKPLGLIEAAWIAGYVAHCVTDAVVHPIVEAIVGPYEQNKAEHRLCEMVQDTLLYSEVRGRDLKDSEYVFVLRACRESPQRIQLFDDWANALRWTYPNRKVSPEPMEWYRRYAFYGRQRERKKSGEIKRHDCLVDA